MKDCCSSCVLFVIYPQLIDPSFYLCVANYISSSLDFWGLEIHPPILSFKAHKYFFAESLILLTIIFGRKRASASAFLLHVSTQVFFRKESSSRSLKKAGRKYIANSVQIVIVIVISVVVVNRQ